VVVTRDDMRQMAIVALECALVFGPLFAAFWLLAAL
jgi:hypothetical protein